MLFPRFTLRIGLVALTLGAVTAIVAREALAGQAWAIGVIAALGIAGLSLALQSVSFALSLLFSRSEREGDA